MNRFFIYFGLISLLGACSGKYSDTKTIDWSDIDTGPTTSAPSNMYGRQSDGYGTEIDESDTYNIAVLLPLSGSNSSVGETIRSSIIAAVLSNAPNSLSVSFFDTANNLQLAFDSALKTNPQIILGPVFSDNVRAIRDIKPNDLPIISFTSDTTALGDGVMTMALMPSNSVESIIREMSADKINNFIIIAPETPSGHLMAGIAKTASDIYNINLNGVFYYQESNPDSIKETANAASMNNIRTAAHTRALTVLSDILTNEQLNILEKSNLNNQLEKLSKTEIIGTIPYDAILFLGNGDDTKTLVSFLRYYNISASEARLYGTTMWDGYDIASDPAMSGAKYSSLVPTGTEFSTLFHQVSGVQPNRLASFSYDATNMAISTIYSTSNPTTYLFNPSGYIGTDGLFRLKPTGNNERALRILQLNASGTPTEVRTAAQTFITPLYNINPDDIKPIQSSEIKTIGIDPDDYIKIPERFRSKYNSAPIGTNTRIAPDIERSKLVAILPDAEQQTIKSENFTPIKTEQIKRTFIDEYEIYD